MVKIGGLAPSVTEIWHVSIDHWSTQIITFIEVMYVSGELCCI